MKRYLILILFLTAALTAAAQKYPERSLVRRGNRAYDRGRYEVGIERYTRALEAAPGNWEAMYDLGNALASAERFDKAEETLRAAAADSLRSGDERAEAYFNLGNVQLAQQKLKEALESYKNSLRMNPADEEAKYNYVYVKRLLDDQEQNGGGGGDDRNQDQNQEQQQGDNGDKGDNSDDKGDPDNNDDENNDGEPDRSQGDDERDGEEKESPAEPRISEQEQERMLEAIQAEEDKTQDKLKDKVRGVVVRGRKNW